MFTADNTKSYILVSKLTFRALALCQSEGRNCELCVCVYMQKMVPRYWWEYGDEKARVLTVEY